jgi:hypoxanthine phosphoribosyltransferase
MNQDSLSNADISCLFTPEQIQQRVRELAAQISLDYQDKPLLLLGVLKGAWIFLADLVRYLSIPVRCDFVRLSSYGSGTSSTGHVQCVLDLTTDLHSYHVLVVEDIVDTGHSLRWLAEHLRQKNPLSVRFCTLLDNPQRRILPIAVDYVGFRIGNYFVVGYGIDYAECYRQLPFIGYLKEGVVPHAQP